VRPGATHVRQSFTYLRGQSSSIGAYLSVNGGAFVAQGVTTEPLPPRSAAVLQELFG